MVCLQITWKLLKHDNNHIPTSKVHFQLTRNRTFSGVALPTDLYLITFTFHLCVSVFRIVGKHWFWSELVSVSPYLKRVVWFPTLSIFSSATKNGGDTLKPFPALGRLLWCVFQVISDTIYLWICLTSKHNIHTKFISPFSPFSVMTSSPTLPMASTLLLPTTTHLTPSPSPSHTPALHTPSPPVHIISHLTPSPSQSHTPALHTPSPPVHIISHLTPSLTTRSLPHTSPTIQPETPNTG